MSSRNIILYAELSYDNETITLYGTQRQVATYVTIDGIEGWYSTPDSKWDLTERSYRDGAYELGSTNEIIYASRVITVHIGVVDTNRANVLDRIMEVLRCAGKVVTLRVVDDWADMYCKGYATIETEPEYDEQHAEMTLTLECPDPFKYASEGTSGYQSIWVYNDATGFGTGGLYYNEDHEGLVYVLSYGDTVSTTSSVNYMTNNGTMTAYPTVYLYNIEDPGSDYEFTVQMSVLGETHLVSYNGYIGGEPVVLDYNNHRASRAGTDTSKYINERDFTGVASGETAYFKLLVESVSGNKESDSIGKAYIVLQDTYI